MVIYYVLHFVYRAAGCCPRGFLCVLGSSATVNASCLAPSLLGLRSDMGDQTRRWRNACGNLHFSVRNFPGESCCWGSLTKQEPELIFCICRQTVDFTGENWNTGLENSLEISHIQGIKSDFICGKKNKPTSKLLGQVYLPRKALSITLKEY